MLKSACPPLLRTTPPPVAGSNQAIRWLVFTRAKEFFAGPGGDPNKLSVLHTIAASVVAGTASVYGCVEYNLQLQHVLLS